MNLFRHLGVAWTVLAWATLIAIAIYLGAFRLTPGHPPLAILVAVLLPPTLFLLLYRSVERVRETVHQLDVRELVLLHAWRMLGLGFVFLWAHDVLPALFALPAGLGDAAVAVGAVWLGAGLYRDALDRANTPDTPSGIEPTRRRALLLWNALGLVDFVLAVTLGVVTRSTWAGNTSTSEAMGSWPLVLIPAFIVPLYTVTHLAVWLQVRSHSTAASTGGRQPAPITR